jgi:glycerol-3-phosphate dehydrogenase (NAD(P)+)
MIKISVIGAGSWGTAVALHLAKKKHDVTLWETFPDYLKVLQAKRENVKFLPGIKFPDELVLTSDINTAVKGKDVIVLAIPSQYLKKVLERIKNFDKKTIFVSLVKGFEENTLLRISELVKSILGDVDICALSGPSIAVEFARDIPTTIVGAGNIETTKKIQEIFMGRNLRVYTNTDIVGVELGGALKNIIAIACGISDGLGYGDNTKAALMTRGLAEISRLGIKMGADPLTFAGLAGMGDMIVTCTSKHSRNRGVGEKIGKGETLNKILKDMHMVAEGVWTVKSVLKLAEKFGVEMPIARAVYEILWEGKKPFDEVGELMGRTPKEESIE